MGPLLIFAVGIVFPALIFAGPYPNFHSELELQLLDQEKDWWESSSLYQIYPRSFKDSDGDGIGDIKGITQSLQYLKEIGVTGTWLSPIFKSPMADFGYDIADFYDIQPEYGTLEDFDELIAEARKLGLKIILDFVPNHSSDECEWFQKSLNKQDGYDDFYVWHPGFPDPNNSSNRLPPSNWVSVFRKSAWTWREERQEFYLHQFAIKQPDLNYRNPAVVQKMKDVLTFWFDRGADGFRIDAIPHLFEKETDSNGNFLDEPWGGWTNDTDDYGYLDHIYTKDQPETIEMVYQWRKLADDYQKEHGGDTKILLTEAYSPIDVIMQYYGNGTHEGAHIPFNFLFIEELNGDSNANDYKNVINKWMDNMPAGRTANWVLGNHDKSRVGSRFGEEKIDLLNMLMMVMPGATVTYNGEEIGMTDVYISWNDTVDPQACNTNPDIYLWYTRDPARTPFQWDDSTSAGFSTNKSTWLPVAENYAEVNVKQERKFIKSHLHTYNRAKALRSTKTLQDGNMKVEAVQDRVLVIIRELSGQPTYVYVANIGSKLERVDLTTVTNLPNVLNVAVSSIQSPRRIGESIKTKELILLPNEALILQTGSSSTSILGYYFYLFK